jgi:Tol biopolymer transport system component
MIQLQPCHAGGLVVAHDFHPRVISLHRPILRRWRPVATLLLAACLGSCDWFTGPDVGSVVVQVSTSGGSLDKDGYTVTVDGVAAGTVAVQDSLVIDSVATGSVSVGLDGVASNCSVADPNPMVVHASEAGTQAAFQVVCLQQLAFMSDRDGTRDIFIVNEDGTGLTKLRGGPGDESQPRWAPDGSRLAFVTTQAGGPDLWVLDYVHGGPEQAISTLPLSQGDPEWSPDGQTIAFASAEPTEEWNLKAARADGSEVWNLTADPADDLWATWAPDGRRLAFTSWRDGNAEIYLVDADGTNLTRLTTDPAEDEYPDWSPSGDWIVFNSRRTGGYQVFKVRPDGSELVQLTIQGALRPRWSPDGTKIAILRGGAYGTGVAVMNPDGSDLTPLTDGSEHDDRRHTWSPDGRWIAFTRYWSDSGRWDIVLVSTIDASTHVLTGTGAWNDFADWRP